MRPTPPLRPCTVVVAGANGRVGSMVCRQLLRTQPKVTVRALVRSADRAEDYARLSYEVGAEDAQYAVRPAWSLAPEEDGGGLTWATQTQFDVSVQSSYGLDRLQIVPCELRHEADVKAALTGADALIYCASDFSPSNLLRLPAPLGNALKGISKFGADLFELRIPGFGRGLPGRGEGGRDEEEEARLARLESIRAFRDDDNTVDDRGAAIAARAVADEIGRKARVSALTGGKSSAGGGGGGVEGAPTPFVLASATAALGYDGTVISGATASGGETSSAQGSRENEFGSRKRAGEAMLAEALRQLGVRYAIVRLARLDGYAPSSALEEGLPLRWRETGEMGTVRPAPKGTTEGPASAGAGGSNAATSAPSESGGAGGGGETPAGRSEGGAGGTFTAGSFTAGSGGGGAGPPPGEGDFIAVRDAAAALVDALVGGLEEGGCVREVFTQTREERAAPKSRVL